MRLSKLKIADNQETKEQLKLLNFFGKPLKILNRCEPSDIIWTNKKVQGWKKCKLLL